MGEKPGRIHIKEFGPKNTKLVLNFLEVNYFNIGYNKAVITSQMKSCFIKEFRANLVFLGLKLYFIGLPPEFTVKQ